MYRYFVRALIGIAVAIALVCCQETMVLAVTTGAINGTVTDLATHQPIAGVKVVALSPSGNYSTTTNATGFYVLQGLPPDTYVVEVSKSGYITSMTQGVTISQGGTAITLALTLSTQPKVLGTIAVRGVTNYVQPTQTTDQYVVTQTQSTQLLNDPYNTNEAQLLLSVPGVSSAGGFPLLRGGLENQVAIQLEGITITDPFTNQFANNLIINGVKTFSVTQGAGDATQGGAGTGGINSVAKIGTYPPSGAMQTELGWDAYQHNFNLEYGIATPDQRFSWYFSGRYDRQAGLPGIPHTKDVANLNDTLGDLAFITTDDSVVNIHYKSPSLRNDYQLFYETGTQGFTGNYGINANQLFMYTQDPNYQLLYPIFCCGVAQPPGSPPLPPAITPNQLPVFPTVSPTLVNPPVPNQQQTYTLAKLGISRQLSEGTFLTARLYRTTGSTPFYITESNYPYLGTGFPGLNFGDFYELEQYRQTGVAFDLQRQAGDKNFVSVGAEYRQSSGSIVTAVPSASFLFDNPIWQDFAGAGSLAPGSPPGPFGVGGTFGGANGFRLPTFSQTSGDPVYFGDAYVTDVFRPTDRITLQPGVRFDSQRVPTPAGLYAVHQLSPKFGTSYQLSSNTVVRASYGHGTIFAPLGQIEGAYTPPLFYHQFPATTTSTCGQFPVFGQPCADYYQQIADIWYANNGVAPYAFPKAQQSDSYDFSFEHDFGRGMSMKLTPYYRRDYDVIVSQGGVPIVISGTQFTGPQTLTNNARGETFGIELGVSKQVPQGLSGQFNVTYINQFINYQSANAFLPSVLQSTLATLAHPSYLPPLAATLALDEHRNGWHVNPTFIYSHGVPIGVPNNVYTLINGVYQAVPNTNLNSSSAGNCFFVDPQLPGPVNNPNIVGALGGNCDKARNGALTKANVLMNIGVSRDVNSRMSLGIVVNNVFNNRTNGSIFNANPGYINNGFGAYGPGSGVNQYAPGTLIGAGLAPILGAPNSFPPDPYFVTNSNAGVYGQFYVTVKM
jgi:hypothetical protein